MSIQSIDLVCKFKVLTIL